MTQPLALLYFRRQLAGNQLAIRLQDLQYRVNSVSTIAELAAQARGAGVMLIVADVENAEEELWKTVRALRDEKATCHLPIIAYADSNANLQSAQKSGCRMAVEASALLTQLPAILEQALSLD